jgi:hypothetical protein
MSWVILFPFFGDIIEVISTDAPSPGSYGDAGLHPYLPAIPPDFPKFR